MQISFESDISKITAKISNLAKSIKDKAISRALTDTIKVVNTEVVKSIRSDGYNIAAAKIKQRIKITTSTVSTLRAKLRAIDRPVNLKEYGAKAYGKPAFSRGNGGLIKVNQGGGVTVKVKRTRKRIPHAFISPRSGNVMMRASHSKGGKTFAARRNVSFGNGFKFNGEQVKQLYGPGVSQVVATKAIQAGMDGKAREHFPKRLIHYFKRLID